MLAAFLLSPLTRTTFFPALRPPNRRPRPLLFAASPRLLYSPFPSRHFFRLRAKYPPCANLTSDPEEAFLQCIECMAVYHVEPEEIQGSRRIVSCSACLHEWYATDEDLLWGNEQAKAALTLAAERTQGTNAYVAPREVQEAKRSTTDNNPTIVFVGNLSFRATGEDLHRAFSGYGAVLKCELPADATGAPRGFAFVEMHSRSAALQAIESLQGTSIVGRDVALSEAKPRNYQPRRQISPPRLRHKSNPKLKPDRSQDGKEQTPD